MPDFEPISSYGLLADCNTAALVSRAGSVDWLCLPHYDSPSVFCRLLDPDGGHWALRPVDDATVQRAYVPGSLVLQTTFNTAAGVVRVTDALAFADGQRGHDLGLHPPHQLLRLVEGLSGSVEMEMELAPRPEYGLVRPLFRRTHYGGRTFGGPGQFSLSAAVDVEIADATMTARLTAEAGSSDAFCLTWAPPEKAPPETCGPDVVAGRIDDTVAAWRSWEVEHDIYEGSHHDLVRLSSRVLKGLSFRHTGAIVAAPTTSLPEQVGGERNWDYRYAWIRDASLTLKALYIGTCPEEATEFLSFMTAAAGGHAGETSSLQIMYGIRGDHDLSERELPHLRGWCDSRPVRVGNAAWDQVQLDVYGELLDAIHLYRERLGDLHPEIQCFVADLADAAARRWREPDSGMWEMRGEPAHHVSSKVMCWVALDRAVRLASRLGEHDREAGWAAERDMIREEILERSWSKARGAFTQTYDSDELDAAALLMPLVGFLPADDKRMRSTVEAIASDLTRGGLVVRYRSDPDGDNADGLRGDEGTFVICSFWLVSCLAMMGERERAEALFDRVVGHANDLGLLAEEVDHRTGELLGNFPQAFSHVGLITAAWALDRAHSEASGESLAAHGRSEK